VVVVLRIRNATATEAPVLEALQRRSSDVWEEYREQLAVNPDADRAASGLHRQGTGPRRRRYPPDAGGFLSVVVPTNGSVHELDGLFVEPDQMSSGVGRALVEDAAARASDQGAEALEVTAGPAHAFYERVGFNLTGPAHTRFGPARTHAPGCPTLTEAGAKPGRNQEGGHSPNFWLVAAREPSRGLPLRPARDREQKS
jgi:GNAT superfamily N-acetyltransferase